MCFTRPGTAIGDAAATLVGQCAIYPFISTSPSLHSAISPLTHHPPIHPSLPPSIYPSNPRYLPLTLCLSRGLLYTKCPLADEYFQVLNESEMPNEVCKCSRLIRLHAHNRGEMLTDSQRSDRWRCAGGSEAQQCPI